MALSRFASSFLFTPKKIKLAKNKQTMNRFILHAGRLRAVPWDGHASEESASEEIERGERKPRGLYTEILTTAISASLKTDFFHVILIISIMTPAVVPIFRAILRIHIFTISSWLSGRLWRLSWRTRSRCLCATRNGWLSCSTLKIVKNTDKSLTTALNYEARPGCC